MQRSGLPRPFSFTIISKTVFFLGGECSCAGGSCRLGSCWGELDCSCAVAAQTHHLFGECFALRTGSLWCKSGRTLTAAWKFEEKSLRRSSLSCPFFIFYDRERKTDPEAVCSSGIALQNLILQVLLTARPLKDRTSTAFSRCCHHQTVC